MKYKEKHDEYLCITNLWQKNNVFKLFHKSVNVSIIINTYVCVRVYMSI